MMRLWEIETEDKTAPVYVHASTWGKYTIAALTFKSAIKKVEKQMCKFERVKNVTYTGKLDE